VDKAVARRDCASSLLSNLTTYAQCNQWIQDVSLPWQQKMGFSLYVLWLPCIAATPQIRGHPAYMHKDIIVIAKTFSSRKGLLLNVLLMDINRGKFFNEQFLTKLNGQISLKDS